MNATAPLRAPGALATLFGALAAACALAQPGDPPKTAEAIVADIACNSCHDSRPVPGAPPLAPAWSAIAARWRGVPDAEERLAAVIAGGSRERHWEGSTMFDSMLPHEPWVAPDEARAIARWILADH